MSARPRILLLTGHLARPALERVLASMGDCGFDHHVHDIGISVAALMTTDLVLRRLPDAMGCTRVLLPGLCAGDTTALSERYGVPVERGPKDLKDLPAFLGGQGRSVDLSRHDMTLVAEIVDAVDLDIPAILERAARYVADGADVIDLGCLPGRAFGHLEEAIQALKAAGHRVSVDSLDPEELRRGARAGADYLLSLKEATLDLAFEVDAVPVLIPERPGDDGSLERCIERLLAAGRPFIADSILEPIHFGFGASIARYVALRERYPDIEIMMGVGNLTELTHADTIGINTLLAGVMSELGIRWLLTTEVSPHARSAVREFDLARRVMFAARADGALPRAYSDALMPLHARRPWTYTEAEIRELAASVRDPNYRINVGPSGVHVYNRDGLWTAQDPFAFYPLLAELEDDPPHAFYMGAELARAQIAWQLGKPYAQDEELDWGVAWRGPQAEPGAHNPKHSHKAEGTTMQARRERRRRGGT
jgi:dihydropteroate synthase